VEEFNKIISCTVKGPYFKGESPNVSKETIAYTSTKLSYKGNTDISSPDFDSKGQCKKWCKKDGFKACKDKCRDRADKECNAKYNQDSRKRKKCIKNYYKTYCKKRNQFCRDKWIGICEKKCGYPRIQFSGKGKKKGETYNFRERAKLISEKDFKMKCDSGVLF
jgi:hypothetical protein